MKKINAILGVCSMMFSLHAPEFSYSDSAGVLSHSLGLGQTTSREGENVNSLYRNPARALQTRNLPALKSGVDHLKSLWLAESDKEDVETRKAMYQLFRMFLADIEGDFDLRDKLILDPTSDQMTNVSDGWRRYLRLKSGKANHNDLVISEVEIRGTNELRMLEDFFKGSKLEYAGNHEFYAELYLARFTQGQSSWISSLHAQRAWELNNRQAMSAMMLSKSMIAQKQYSEVVDILKKSIPFSNGTVKRELERDLELAQRRWKNKTKERRKTSRPTVRVNQVD